MLKRWKKSVFTLSLFLMPFFLVSCFPEVPVFKGNFQSNTKYEDVFQASVLSVGEGDFKDYITLSDIKTGQIVAEREGWRMNITVKKEKQGTLVDVSVEKPSGAFGNTESMFNDFAKALKNKVPDVVVASTTQSKYAENKKIADMTYSASFDKVWKSVTTVVQKEGLEVKAMDRNSGFIAGTKAMADIILDYSTRLVINIVLLPSNGTKSWFEIRSSFPCF